MRKLYFKILILLLSLTFSLELKSQWVVNSNLQQNKVQLSTAKWGDSILFFGGYSYGNYVSTVEIYNTNTETWENSTNLSVAKRFTTAVTGDSAVYVIGGDHTPGSIVGSNLVEIYKNGTWTVDTLPGDVLLAEAQHVGSKIIIMGGLRAYTSQGPDFNPFIFMYDELTGQWTTDTIGVPRQGMGSASNGSIAIFAGGLSGLNTVTGAVDIYNATNDTWISSNLIFPRYRLSAAYADGKFLFAGGGGSGISPTNYVEIYDTSFNFLQLDTLSEARSGAFSAVTDSKILFTAGGDLNAASWGYTSSSDVTDIYDIASGTWTSALLNEPRINHTAIGHKNKAYVAGGIDLGTGTTHDGLEVIEFTPVISGFDKGPNKSSRELLKIVDVLGRETEFKANTLQLYLYSDGHVEKKIVSK